MSRKTPTTEAEFIRRANKLRDQEQEGHRWCAIGEALAGFVETIEAGRAPMACYVTDTAMMHPEGSPVRASLLQTVLNRDVTELKNLGRVAEKKYHALWDAEEGFSVVLGYQPTTPEGRLAKIDLCFEIFAAPNISDDCMMEVAASGRATLAEMRQQAPADSTRKAA